MKAKKVEVHLKIQFLFFYKTNIWLKALLPARELKFKIERKKASNVILFNSKR